MKMASVTAIWNCGVRLFLLYFPKISIQGTKYRVGTVLDEQVVTTFTPLVFVFFVLLQFLFFLTSPRECFQFEYT